jgi:hypothetical protein
MAVVTVTPIKPLFPTVLDGQWITVPYTTLTAADTLTGWEEGKRQILWLFNPTGGTLNVLFAGVGVPTGIWVDGFGNRTFFDDGLTLSVSAGSCRVLPMDTVPQYFRGASVINITGGTGAYCALLEPVPPITGGAFIHV